MFILKISGIQKVRVDWFYGKIENIEMCIFICQVYLVASLKLH